MIFDLCLCHSLMSQPPMTPPRRSASGSVLAVTHSQLEMRPWKKLAPGVIEISEEVDTREPDVEDVIDPVNVNLVRHREINSDIFHRGFADKLSIRHDDRLLIHREGGERPFGLSRIRSHQCLNPELYRSDGVLRPGRSSRIIDIMASLPGFDAVIPDIDQLDRLMTDLFLSTLIEEQDLMVQLGSLCGRLMSLMGPDLFKYRSGTNVPLGAYGSVAFSNSTDSLCIPETTPPPSPRHVTPPPKRQRSVYVDVRAAKAVAIIGKCDMTFNFGSDKEKFVAVVEGKIFKPARVVDYHRCNNAICAQIFTSLIGSDAPLGIVLANGAFKLIWKEEVGEETYFYTYPEGNDLADFYHDEPRKVFVQVMFHVVRCAVVTELEGTFPIPEPETRPIAAAPGLEPKYDSAKSGSVRGLFKGINFNSIPFEKGATRSGTPFEFARYPLGHLSRDEILRLSCDLINQERERRNNEILESSL